MYLIYEIEIVFIYNRSISFKKQSKKNTADVVNNAMGKIKVNTAKTITSITDYTEYF